MIKVIENINKKYHIPIYIGIYLLLRLITYFFQPEHIINTIISLVVLLTVVYLLWNKNSYGWYVVATEIILGGVGNFLSINSISLRTCLLLCSITIFFINKVRTNNFRYVYLNNKNIYYLYALIYGIVGFSVVNGYLLGNNFKLIIADAIPYIFLLYYFPLKELYLEKKFRSFILSLLVASIIGNLLFILFTFILFSANIFVLHDSYYKYFRDIAGGKITNMGNNFFRIVLNEHILLVPTLIYFVYKSITSKKNIYIISSVFLLVILSINLSRIYILAFVLSLFLLFSIKYWKRYLIHVLLSLLILVISFVSIHFIASKGQSFGLELFGLRIQSIAKPDIEQSSVSRMMILPKIVKKIQEKPVFGHGLGSEVMVYSPILERNIITNHLDWGYLEIVLEMGTLGLLMWLLILIYISNKVNLIKSIKENRIKMYLSMLIALMIINLTAPAFFHVLGILLVTIFLVKNNTKFTYSAGGVVINSKKQLALVKQDSSSIFPSSWCYPKGHVEVGENSLQAARREIYEEAGIEKLEYIKKIGVLQRYRGSDSQSGEIKIITMFLFKSNQTVLQSLDADNPEAEWCDLDKARKKMTYREDREFFDNIYNEIIKL